METSEMKRIIVLIPAYKPDRRLIDLTRSLTEAGFPVLLVDDGGGSAFSGIFSLSPGRKTSHARRTCFFIRFQVFFAVKKHFRCIHTRET